MDHVNKAWSALESNYIVQVLNSKILFQINLLLILVTKQQILKQRWIVNNIYKKMQYTPWNKYKTKTNQKTNWNNVATFQNCNSSTGH